MDRLRYSSDGGVFNLPWLVAEQEGFFADEGLDVAIIDRDPAESAINPFDRKKESQLESAVSQVYTVCEWGGIKRAAEGSGGRILFKHPMSTVFSIMTPSTSGITRVEELARVPIAVSQDAGSYYIVIEELERVLPAEEIELVHIGAPLARTRALVAGEIQAAVMMEPYTTLLKRKGFVELLRSRPERGVVMGSTQLSPDTVERFVRAVNRAVRHVNAAPDRYSALLLEEVPAELRDDQPIAPPTYYETEPYAQQDFDPTYEWMVRHNMIRPGLRYDELVEITA
jgi:NitT/TauT family transport system substrate-binding protein